MSAAPQAPDQYAVHWPEPPHVRLTDTGSGPQPCEIEFKSGAREKGELLHFTGRDSTLIFKPHQSHPQHNRRINVDLSKVREVRLTHQVAARPLEDSALGADTMSPPSEVQVYSIEFFDGSILCGETVGFVKAPDGLFLFFNVEDSALISRVFIPDSAIAYYQIGDPIGKILVDENVVSEDQLKEAVEKQQAMRKLVLGDYLIEQGVITPRNLQDALQYQREHPSLRLGEALIALGVLTQEVLQASLSRQRANRGRPLGQILVDMGVLDPETLKKVNAKKMGLPFVSLKNFRGGDDVLKLIPASIARRLGVMPLAIEDGALIVASDSAPAPQTLTELGLVARMRVVPVIALADEIRLALDACYGPESSIQPVTAGPDMIRFEAIEEITAEPVPDSRMDDLFGKGSTLEFAEDVDLDSERALLHAVDRLLSAAVKGGTLELRIETDGARRRTQIRFRKDSNS